MLNAVTQYFSGFWGQMELIATLLLIVNVYLLAKQRLINYAFGFAGVVVMGFVLKEFQLYSDMLLQWAFYAPLQIIGWYMWKYGRTVGDTSEDRPLDSMQIVRLGPLGWVITSGVVGLSAAAVGYYFANNTDASFPYLDALTTTMSIAASVLMLKKILDNWIIWITMDVIAIPLYYTKELYVVSGLYVIFLGLATYGLVTWVNDYRKGGNHV